jgi:hypothetical protein
MLSKIEKTHNRPQGANQTGAKKMKVVMPGVKKVELWGTLVEAPDYECAVENLHMIHAAWKAASKEVEQTSAIIDCDNGYATTSEKEAASKAATKLVELSELLQQQKAILPFELCAV